MTIPPPGEGEPKHSTEDRWLRCTCGSTKLRETELKLEEGVRVWQCLECPKKYFLINCQCCGSCFFSECTVGLGLREKTPEGAAQLYKEFPHLAPAGYRPPTDQEPSATA